MKAISKILTGKYFTGIEVKIISDNEMVFNTVSVKLCNSKLFLENSQSNITIEGIKSGLIDTKRPACVVVTGKGIVTKQLNNDQIDEKSLAELLPFANPDDFEYYVYRDEQSKPWISIIRKSILERVIQLLKEISVLFIEVFIGPAIINSIREFLTLYTDSVIISGCVVKFSDSGLLSIEKTEVSSDDYCFNNQWISGDKLLALAAIVLFYFEQECRSQSGVLSVKYAIGEFIVNRLKRLVIRYGIIFMFVLLTLNFFAYSYYNKKVSSANDELVNKRAFIKMEKALREEYILKKELLKKAGLENKVFMSFIVDRLVHSKPKAIVLKNLDVNPVEINQFKNEVRVDNGIVKIAGTAQTSKIINNWVSIIDNLDFVSSVEVKDITFSKKNKESEFKLTIKLKH